MRKEIRRSRPTERHRHDGRSADGCAGGRSEGGQRGRQAEAIAEQKKAIDIQPHHDRWLYALAQRDVQAGEYANALGPLGEALAMHPNLKGQLATDAVFEPMKPFAEFQRMLER